MDKKRNAVLIAVVMFGIISCFGDIVYEGARSANGQYFSLLAVDATLLGFIYGLGEFLGYALRLFSGRLSDKTGKHWPFIFIGYGMLIVVPLMGFTKSIPLLMILFLLERIGKALRSPAKDTILSQIAQNSMGTGLVFGIQEALDQIGAFLGPMVFTLSFILNKTDNLESYQLGYKLLGVGYLLVMIAVFIAFKKISQYKLIQDGQEIKRADDQIDHVFWTYSLFTFLSSMGLVAYSIVGFHLKTHNLILDKNITFLYAVAMIVDAVMAIIIGRLYDRLKAHKQNKTAGLNLLILLPILTVLIPITLFNHNKTIIILGYVFYGMLLGVHETIMKSAIADITSFHKRGTAYGIFNSLYGLSILIGSSLMGFLYDKVSLQAIFIFVIICEGLAYFMFLKLKKEL